MLPDEQPVEYILEGIDAEMALKTQPKVILFDIGGVVVSASALVSWSSSPTFAPRLLYGLVPVPSLILANSSLWVVKEQLPI